jgi:flagellar biosynthesis protein FlhG
MFNKIASQAHKLVDLGKNNNDINSKTKIIAITSGKGGVGKSTFTANISYLFSKNKRVLVIDADIGLANMQIMFDIKPKNTIHEYINNRAKLSDIIIQTKYSNISLIAGKSGHNYLLDTSSFSFKNLINELKFLNVYDYILIDTSAGLNKYVQEFLDLSDEIIGITTTDPSAITDVYALIKMVGFSKKRLFLVFNQTKSYQIGQTITQSLLNLANKNMLNKNFMVKYIGNIVADLNIATTNRLRKLYVKELSYIKPAQNLQDIIIKLIKEVR